MFDIAYNFWTSWLFDSISPSTTLFTIWNWTFNGVQFIRLLSLVSCVVVILTACWVIYKLISFVMNLCSRW